MLKLLTSSSVFLRKGQPGRELQDTVNPVQTTSGSPKICCSSIAVTFQTLQQVTNYIHEKYMDTSQDYTSPVLREFIVYIMTSVIRLMYEIGFKLRSHHAHWYYTIIGIVLWSSWKIEIWWHWKVDISWPEECVLNVVISEEKGADGYQITERWN